MNSVGDTGGNIGSEVDSVLGSALFLKLFLKTGRKLILFKDRKRIRFQVIYTSNISYILEFPLDI